ncbi:hypothetical protein ZHAS_00020262 [Anopheles sinensis]|uniref:C2H2-type domain-containing protein n=1 Tax=Anopheles sinensis TaxID=74873 RepID=A0A084WPD1_ANOSI|nr:hypothetical protein ZHAS_00020262 [Anopheles sinensis]
MEPFNYYRPAMDFYGSDPYYFPTTGMSSGGGETFSYGTSTTTIAPDPQRNDAPYWPNRDVAQTIPWDTTIFNGGYDARMIPSAWTYDYFNNQVQAETVVTNHTQMPGMYVDSEALPIPCAVCPKQFFYRMDLIRHDYKHSGKSPHVCSFCSKIFSRQDHLRRHEFIHKRQNSADDDNAES